MFVKLHDSDGILDVAAQSTTAVKVLFLKLLMTVMYGKSQNCYNYIRGSRKFCQRGTNNTDTFLFYYFSSRWDGERIESSVRQRNAIEMAFRWRADNGQSLNAGLVALFVLGDPDQ